MNFLLLTEVSKTQLDALANLKDIFWNFVRRKFYIMNIIFNLIFFFSRRTTMSTLKYKKRVYVVNVKQISKLKSLAKNTVKAIWPHQNCGRIENIKKLTIIEVNMVPSYSYMTFIHLSCTRMSLFFSCSLSFFESTLITLKRSSTNSKKV